MTSFVWQLSALILCLIAWTPLAALEKNEQQYNFLFSTKEKVVPGHATTFLHATSADKRLPFIMVGRPLTGELTIVQPDDDDMLSLTRKDQAAASLLGYGDLEGEFSVDFSVYSGGWPAQHQLGMELYKERPVWTLDVKEIVDFAFHAEKKSKKKKKGTSGGGEGAHYKGTLKGELRIGSKITIPLVKQIAKITIHEPSSNFKLSEHGASISYENARIGFVTHLKLKGKQLGWAVEDVTMEIAWFGFADIKKATDKLFKDNLPKIRIGE